MFSSKRFSLSPFLFLFVLFLQMGLSANNYSKNLKKIEKAFVSFEYRTVIRLSDSLLAHPTAIDTSQIIEILRMKAISHFALNQEDLATLAFMRILQMDRNYQLDPIINSPKIIAFFQNIKKDFLNSNPVRPEKKKDIQPKQQNIALTPYRQALWRSMVLPGWGHLKQERKVKGVTLLGLSGVTLGASIYYIIRTQQLEKDYLNSIEQKEIDERYEKYNQAFKIRNALLIGYLVIWSYTQFDIFKCTEQKMSVELRQTAIYPQNYLLLVQVRF